MFKEILKLAKKVSKFKNVLLIVLFGSVARGEATSESDIDIAIIYDKKDKQTISEINKITPERIQLTHLSMDELPNEEEIVGALSGEGIILYGRPFVFKAEDFLIPKMLIIYNMDEIPQSDRSKLRRALYGGRSVSYKNGKKYVSVFKGAIEQEGIEKIGKAVLLVNRGKDGMIKGILKRYKTKWKEIPVWTY